MSRPDFLVCDGHVFPCRCVDHITAATHIPVCPRPGHNAPLRPFLPGATDTAGQHAVCPDCYHIALRVAASRHRPDVPPVYDYPPHRWAWEWRDLFNGADLPPGNGMQPLDLTWMDD